MSGPKATPTPAAPPAPPPPPYWTDASLRLTKGSIDAKSAKKHKTKPNVPGNYVSDLQGDLITLGYLRKGADDGSFGDGNVRVLTRFQRHAKRSFRWDGTKRVDVQPWVGVANGVCDQNTAKEVRQWIDKGFKLPLGMFKIVKIDGGRLREDVAALWKTAMENVVKKGGLIIPDGAATKDFYSDTTRNPGAGFTNTGGNSKTSLHYTGRAVDLSMAPNGGKNQRWWVAKEPVSGKVFWRIWCKTTLQDGTQGVKIAKQTKKHYEFYHNGGEKWIPEAYYLDLTDSFKSDQFERIPAQTGWESVAKKEEWWHFHFTKDLQATFLDEMELLGFSETQLTQFGWTQTDLDKPPA